MSRPPQNFGATSSRPTPLKATGSEVSRRRHSSPAERASLRIALTNGGATRALIDGRALVRIEPLTAPILTFRGPWWRSSMRPSAAC